MFKIRVTNGVHRQGPKYKIDEKTGRRIETEPGRNYVVGEVFESPTDLSKKYPEKYARVDVVEAEGPLGQEAQDEDDEMYEAMTMEELKKLAIEYEIEVKGNISKKDLISRIKEAVAV